MNTFAYGFLVRPYELLIFHEKRPPRALNTRFLLCVNKLSAQPYLDYYVMGVPEVFSQVPETSEDIDPTWTICLNKAATLLGTIRQPSWLPVEENEKKRVAFLGDIPTALRYNWCDFILTESDYRDRIARAITLCRDRVRYLDEQNTLARKRKSYGQADIYRYEAELYEDAINALIQKLNLRYTGALSDNWENR